MTSELIELLSLQTAIHLITQSYFFGRNISVRGGNQIFCMTIHYVLLHYTLHVFSNFQRFPAYLLPIFISLGQVKVTSWILRSQY